MSRTVSKTQLKARMLAYLREVEETGEEIIVTSHGRPVLRVAPLTRAESAAAVFADVRGAVSLPPDDDVNDPVAREAWADSALAELVE